jgi:hypothetical protein
MSLIWAAGFGGPNSGLRSVGKYASVNYTSAGVVIIGEHGMRVEGLRSNQRIELTPGGAPCRSATSSVAGAVHARR